MRVLIGCECSGIVRDAFIARGHDAVSCDLLPTKRPGPHIQGDVIEVLRDGWDLAIFHPDCTYLTVAASWAYKERHQINKKIKPGTLVGHERRAAREQALEFFYVLLCAPIPRICVENPAFNVACTRIRKWDQAIQPHEYGHDASKKTGLWLKNLPPLRSTKHVAPRWVRQASGKLLPRWANQTDTGQNRLPPSADRWYLRAQTYPGWADAMADQWGQLLLPDTDLFSGE